MIILAFGANLPGKAGDPVQTYHASLRALEEAGIQVLHQSSLWETAPVDVPDEQPWYVNAILLVDTEMLPRELLNTLMSIEAQFGRKRTFRNAAKSIDLDLICYHNEVIHDGEDLIVPHPRMHCRAFVLLPLQEIVPEWIHPESGATLGALIAAIPDGQEARILSRSLL